MAKAVTKQTLLEEREMVCEVLGEHVDTEIEQIVAKIQDLRHIARNVAEGDLEFKTRIAFLLETMQLSLDDLEKGYPRVAMSRLKTALG